MLQKSGLSNSFWKCFILRPDLDIEQNKKEISWKTIKLSNNFLQILVSNCPQVSILILSWMSPGSLDQARHVISSESNMLHVDLESFLFWSFPLPKSVGWYFWWDKGNQRILFSKKNNEGIFLGAYVSIIIYP